MLDMSGGFHEMGGVRWQLTLCLLLCWVIVFFALAKGITVSGKVSPCLLSPVPSIHHILFIEIRNVHVIIWYSFYPRDASYSAGISCRRVSVCLSICPSVTNRCFAETAKRRITQIKPHDSPGTPVF